MADPKDAPANTAANDELKAAQAATEAAKAAGVTLAADARKAERARFSAITSHEEAKGREKLATHLASNTDMSAEDAVALLKASAKELPAAQADQFAQYMAKQGNAQVAPTAGAASETSNVIAMPSSAAALEMRRQIYANARKPS